MRVKNSLADWAAGVAWNVRAGTGRETNALGGLTSSPVIASAAYAAFEAGEWALAQELFLRCLIDPAATVDVGACMLGAGRSSIYLDDLTAAESILSEFVERFPDNPDGHFYLARCYQRQHRYSDALNLFTMSSRLASSPVRSLIGVGQCAHALAFSGFGHAEEKRQRAQFALAQNAFTEILDTDPGNVEALSGLALLLLDGGFVGDAIRTSARMWASTGARRVTRQTRARDFALALVRGGYARRLAELAHLEEFEEGRRLLERAARVATPDEPQLEVTRPAYRICYVDEVSGQCSIGTLGRSFLKPSVAAARAITFGEYGPSAECDYVVLRKTRHWAGARAAIARLADLPEDFAGIAFHGPDGSVETVVARHRFWWEFVVASERGRSWDDLIEPFLASRRVYRHAPGREPVASPTAISDSRPVKKMLVLSRHGPRRVGGGEHFLLDAARTYTSDGRLDVYFAGLSAIHEEFETEWDEEEAGIRFGFIEDDPEALRRFVLEQGIDAVHCISGLGEMVSEACEGLGVSLVYGIHFWREFLASSTPSRHYYPDVDRRRRPLEGFGRLLARADFAYVNSDYCRDIALETYRWNPPVIYSVPASEWEDGSVKGDAATAPPGKDYVLLPNCRADKGWHLFLEMAAELPERAFVAIASQSDIASARADVFTRGLRNVQIVAKVAEMALLYENATVVVAPSYRFVETFCRVAVEPGRFAKPVLIAAAGNLDYLGAGTDLALPPRVECWVAAIREIYDNPETRRKLTEQSVALANTFNRDAVRDGARNAIDALSGPRILVCAGSGIGNVCHVTPMIARAASALGTRVDVLLSADAEGLSALLGGGAHVGGVFEDYEAVRYRPYDAVLVTHSFGSVVPDFNSPNVLVSRDLDQFDPAGDVHEAEFNMRFLESALGIQHDPDDGDSYFLGDWQRPAVAGGTLRVALHAGSKDGHWASKRWPHFAALARALQADGAEVISVGLSGEYVEGTVDKTGISFEALADELTACSLVVANDSGLMNIANALGIPIVALFGPTNPVTRGPTNSEAIVLQPQRDCVPCESNPKFTDRFTSGGCRCMELLSVDKVATTVRERLGAEASGEAGE